MACVLLPVPTAGLRRRRIGSVLHGWRAFCCQFRRRASPRLFDETAARHGRAGGGTSGSPSMGVAWCCDGLQIHSQGVRVPSPPHNHRNALRTPVHPTHADKQADQHRAGAAGLRRRRIGSVLHGWRAYCCQFRRRGCGVGELAAFCTDGVRIAASSAGGRHRGLFGGPEVRRAGGSAPETGSWPSAPGSRAHRGSTAAATPRSPRSPPPRTGGRCSAGARR